MKHKQYNTGIEKDFQRGIIRFTEVKKMMKAEPIEAIRKRFHGEWILVAIDRMDKATTTPLTGRLLAHSPRRHEVYERSRRYHKPALVVYSEDTFPKGFAAAFHGAS